MVTNSESSGGRVRRSSEEIEAQELADIMRSIEEDERHYEQLRREELLLEAERESEIEDAEEIFELLDRMIRSKLNILGQHWFGRRFVIEGDRQTLSPKDPRSWHMNEYTWTLYDPENFFEIQTDMYTPDSENSSQPQSVENPTETTIEKFYVGAKVQVIFRSNGGHTTAHMENYEPEITNSRDDVYEAVGKLEQELVEAMPQIVKRV